MIIISMYIYIMIMYVYIYIYITTIMIKYDDYNTTSPNCAVTGSRKAQHDHIYENSAHFWHC